MELFIFISEYNFGLNNNGTIHKAVNKASFMHCLIHKQDVSLGFKAKHTLRIY